MPRSLPHKCSPEPPGHFQTPPTRTATLEFLALWIGHADIAAFIRLSEPGFLLLFCQILFLCRPAQSDYLAKWEYDLQSVLARGSTAAPTRPAAAGVTAGATVEADARKRLVRCPICRYLDRTKAALRQVTRVHRRGGGELRLHGLTP